MGCFWWLTWNPDHQMWQRLEKTMQEKKKTVDLRCLEIDRSWENTYSNDNNRHFGGFCWIFNNSHLGICSFSNNPLRTTCCFSLATTIIPGPRLVTTLFKVEISVFDGQFSGSWNPDQKKKRTSYKLRVHQINCYGYINNGYLVI